MRCRLTFGPVAAATWRQASTTAARNAAKSTVTCMTIVVAMVWLRGESDRGRHREPPAQPAVERATKQHLLGRSGQRQDPDEDERPHQWRGGGHPGLVAGISDDRVEGGRRAAAERAERQGDGQPGGGRGHGQRQRRPRMPGLGPAQREQPRRAGPAADGDEQAADHREVDLGDDQDGQPSVCAQRGAAARATRLVAMAVATARPRPVPMRFDALGLQRSAETWRVPACAHYPVRFSGSVRFSTLSRGKVFGTGKSFEKNGLLFGWIPLTTRHLASPPARTSAPPS